MLWVNDIPHSWYVMAFMWPFLPHCSPITRHNTQIFFESIWPTHCSKSTCPFCKKWKTIMAWNVPGTGAIVPVWKFWFTLLCSLKYLTSTLRGIMAYNWHVPLYIMVFMWPFLPPFSPLTWHHGQDWGRGLLRTRTEDDFITSFWRNLDHFINSWLAPVAAAAVLVLRQRSDGCWRRYWIGGVGAQYSTWIHLRFGCNVREQRDSSQEWMIDCEGETGCDVLCGDHEQWRRCELEKYYFCSFWWSLSSFRYRTCDAPNYGLIHVPPMHKGWLSSSFVLLFLPFVAETKRKHRRSYTWKQALRFLCCNSSQVRTRNQFQQPGMKSFVNVLCIDCYKYSCIELWSSSLVKINERCADCRQEDNSPDLLHYRPWESLICRVLAETTRNRPAAVPGFGNWKMRMRQELLQLHDHFPCRTQDHLLDCMHALQGYYRRRSIGFFEARSTVARTCILARFRGVKLWRSRNNFSNQLHAPKHEDRLRSEWISCYDSTVCCCCLRLCIRGGGCGQDEKRRIGVCSAAWEL